MSSDIDPRYEVVRGFNDDVFAELWDSTLAPGGLAFLLRRSPEGLITLAGFDVDVPVEVFQQFFSEAMTYVVQDLQALLARWAEPSSSD
jgi:predicted aldo/keto reductase-like oxidoreductase